VNQSKYIVVDQRRTLIPKLLEKWLEILNELEEVFAPDNLPYVYNERAQIGILAAAAIRLRCLTFEEYSRGKGQGPKRRAGRADLWLYDRDTGKDFNIEAKRQTVKWNSTDVASVVKESLDWAVKEVHELQDRQAAYNLGIVLLCPWGAKPGGELEATPFWNQLRDRLSYDGDFCAFHLCEPKIWPNLKAHRDCPGIALVGKYHDAPVA